MATDPCGRVVGTTDHFSGGKRVLVARVPTRGVPIIYAVIGDLFGWLGVVGFVGMVIWAVVQRRRAT